MSSRRKKSVKSAQKIARSSISTVKRRGKDIYDVVLPPGFRTQSELTAIVDTLSLTMKNVDNDQMKIIMSAQKGKQKAGMTHLWQEVNIEDTAAVKAEVRTALQDMLSDIFSKRSPEERAKTKRKSWERIQPIKNYIRRIIIDFETASE